MIFVSILENYQRAEVKLEEPPVLREYMGGMERIEPKTSPKSGR